MGCGEPRSVPGLGNDDSVVRWEADGQSLLVARGLLPTRLERFALETGRRELVRTISPGSTVGVQAISNVTVADDPNVYAYSINLQLSRLFIVEGAK